jgi:cyclophilin family peptidyl-prolyl cis-trans isomerase
MAEPVVVLETNQGSIEIELMPSVAPKACENFTQLNDSEREQMIQSAKEYEPLFT